MPVENQPSSPQLLESLRRLSDDELVARAKSLAARERRATALLVARLAELDTRDLHLRAGYSSLFVCCRDVLALSDHEAYNRMEVARTARRFPLVLDLLSTGAVNLTTVRLLGPHLTAGNHARVLESARGKRKAEVEEIVARLALRPDVPASARKLPARTAATARSADSTFAAVLSSTRPHRPSLSSTPVPQAPPLRLRRTKQRAFGPRAHRPRPAVLATSPRTSLLPRSEAAGSPRALGRGDSPVAGSVQVSADNRRGDPRAAPAGQGHAPHALATGDDEALLGRALTLLLDDLARKKSGSERTLAALPAWTPSRATCQWR